MEVEDRNVGWADRRNNNGGEAYAAANDNNVVDLLSSDDEEDRGAAVRNASGVAQMPKRRKRGRQEVAIEIIDDDDDSEGTEKPPPKQKGRTPTSSQTQQQQLCDEVQFVETKKASASLPRSPLEQVLELFPDVQLIHARELLKQHNNVPANVIEALLEAGTAYPKEPVKTEKTVAAPLARWNYNEEGKPTYDFMSTSAFESSSNYWKESAQRLLYDFPCLNLSGARFLLGKTDHHYAVVHDRMVKAITGKDDKQTAAVPGEDLEELQLKKLNAIMFEKGTLDEDQRKRIEKLFNCHCRDSFFAKRPSLKSNPTISDEILKQEVEFVETKLKEWIQSVEHNMNLRAKRQIAIREGSAVDCGCCFDQFVFDEMLQCRDGHLFCRDCLSSYVENQVFANGNFGVNTKTKEPNLELVCFHGDGCAAGFDRHILVIALKPAVLQKYDELQTRVSLAKAGLDQSMCTCPKCGFSAEIPETQNVFACLLCGFESCRHCWEPSHIPLRCDEVEKEAEAQGRARVEEAASAAVIRFCPKCKKGVIKSEGCNKITCACGIKFCYICRKKISDYTHFCQTPHCNHSDPKKCKNKCPLYTTDPKEDERRSREAALAEAKRVEEEMAAKFAKSVSDEKKPQLFGVEDDRKQPAKPKNVHIDVDSILRGPGRRR